MKQFLYLNYIYKYFRKQVLTNRRNVDFASSTDGRFNVIEYLKSEARHFEDILAAGKSFVSWTNDLIKNKNDIDVVIQDTLPNVRSSKRKTMEHQSNRN